MRKRAREVESREGGSESLELAAAALRAARQEAPHAAVDGALDQLGLGAFEELVLPAGMTARGNERNRSLKGASCVRMGASAVLLSTSRQHLGGRTREAGA